MAGIYIPGMEMPENCICCDLSHEDNWCPAKQEYVDRYSFDTCPIIPVPAHGRMGDLDALENRLNSLCQDSPTLTQMANDFINSGIRASIKCLGDVPAIIPAEEGET